MSMSFSYDHPAYIGRGAYAGQILAGAATVGRFVAHADMVGRRSVVRTAVVGTSASQTVIVHKVSGTTTTALHTHTLAATALGYDAADLGAHAFAIGDEIRYTSGTDATAVYAIAFEYQINAGAELGE